jgi:hypothetical protein
MKNVYLLPTDKPTGIFGSKISGLQYSIMHKIRTNPLVGFHLYITSEEAIEEGEWAIATEGIWKNTITKITGIPITDVWRKIILTTDIDLIKDGIQPIDDDFLEWFVKNPNCEEVAVDLLPYDGTKSIDKYWSGEYKIIIPQEGTFINP